ncbi:MAG: AAA-like domain-containing protein, partial [Cyanobacteria bacterium J06621_8]
ISVPLNLSQSLFNTGLLLRLKEFNWEQIEELIKRYGLDREELNIETEQIKSLWQIVGGHPYLMSLAFCHLITQDSDMVRLTKEAKTDTGIYRDHLRSYLMMLGDYPHLAAAFKTVIESDSAVKLNSLEAYELESMGLVKLKADETLPACELYRVYFRDRL